MNFRPMGYSEQKQCYRVVAVEAPTGLGNPKRDVFVKAGTLMEVLGEAQQKYKGRKLSITPIK